MDFPTIAIPAQFLTTAGSNDEQDALADYIKALTAFIDRYQTHYAFHAVDFFVDGTFDEMLPGDWKAVVTGPETDEEFLDHVIEVASNVPGRLALLETLWPASLMEFIRAAHSIGLPRSPLPLDHIRRESIDQNLALGMSAKKRHEVEHLAAFISHVARSAGVNNLIDLGAGQGYLSSVLALRYGHNVLGVDTDPVQTSGAIRRRATLFKRVRHKMESPGRLMYLNKHMTATDTFNGLIRDYETKEREDAELAEREGLQDLSGADVQEEWRKNEQYMAHQRLRLRPSITGTEESVDWSAERWGLIGLHTCGDLSPITLRMWEASSATLVINVGCCYNHISEETPDVFSCDMLAPGTRDKILKSRIISGQRGAGDESMWTADGGASSSAAPPKPIVAVDETGPVTPGFPMSQAVAAHNVHLGWTAKMLACQSTCRWTTQGDRAKEAFRRHVYRALLQEWLVSATGGVSPVVSVHTSKVRRGGLPTFAMYWREAVGALLRDHGPTAVVPADWVPAMVAAAARDSDEDIEAWYSRRIAEGALKQIALVWTLRAMMAEAIESLILVDRYMWVREQQSVQRTVLFPLFDHVESPRNCVIVGIKQ